MKQAVPDAQVRISSPFKPDVAGSIPARGLMPLVAQW